jgi:hypothetical protein
MFRYVVPTFLPQAGVSSRTFLDMFAADVSNWSSATKKVSANEVLGDERE